MRTEGGAGEGSGALLTIERVAVLQRVELFSQVPGHLLVAVARLLEEVAFDAGERVIERGAVEDWLFVIAEGRLRVHLGDRTLQEVGKGGVVGELAVLASAPRSATVTAEEPSLLLRLRRGPLEELLDERPEIARGVIATLVGLLQASHEASGAVTAG
jgi:CRP/FNR family transcriptional regulator, cyclic AMP receptor protein